MAIDPLELIKPVFGSPQKETAIQSSKVKIETPYNPGEVESSVFAPEMFDQLIKARGFFVREPWDMELNIQSRVIQYSNTFVSCECLIDKENKVFEVRNFPRHLFDHISGLEQKPYVLVAIKSKVGSIRIDIADGSKLVDKKFFELNDEWDNLDDSDFNVTLDKPIRL